VGYDEALQELYQAPISQFVAERKRLADELKQTGDGADAKRLLERKRPPISAWVVNQLYWHARDAFDEMLATAEQLRNGHLKATAAHREAIAKLRKRAATILEDAGHAATEATLRRVTQTLAALAATGSFDPDPPGALAADRDPPGFEAVGIVGPPVEEEEPAAKPKAKVHGKHDKDDEAAEERRRAEQAEKKRIEEERKRKAAERHKLETALRSAKNDLDAAQRIVKHLDKQLAKANQDVADAQAAVDDISEKLAVLDAN
jgi:hypothetical protein